MYIKQSKNKKTTKKNSHIFDDFIEFIKNQLICFLFIIFLLPIFLKIFQTYEVEIEEY